MNRRWINGLRPRAASEWSASLLSRLLELSPRSSGNVTLGPSFSRPDGDGEKIVYKHEPAGELEVTDVGDERFDGRFHFTVKGEEPGGLFRSDEEREAAREVVSIVGSFEGAALSCPDQDQ